MLGHCFAVFDMKTFIIINGISFILSAISILFINFKLCEQYINKECSIREINFIKDIKEGYSYLMERESLKIRFCILISLNFS